MSRLQDNYAAAATETEEACWHRGWEPKPSMLDGGMHAHSSVYTLYGTQKVGELAPGDSVITLEYGPQKICEVGRKKILDPLSHTSIQLLPLPEDPVGPSYLCPTQKVLIRRNAAVARVLGKTQAVFDAGSLGSLLGARLCRPEFSDYLSLTLERPATLWTPAGLFECAGLDAIGAQRFDKPKPLSRAEQALWRRATQQAGGLLVNSGTSL